ncbi:MAG: hypothetical protein M3041_09200 [Acidobacteriota bacterium]|nr:hypothetical protein [Acidobacteriota bacterium]
MTRRLTVVLAIALFCVPVYAVDPGKAQGAMTIDGNRVDLNYAYAVDHQKNEVTHRRDDRRVVLTDKPVPEGFKLDDIDNGFPDGVLGLVVCVSHVDKISHVLLQHAKGMYDASYFDDDPNYTFKPLKVERGTIAGNMASRKIKTNTMTFSFVVDFNAPVK